MTVGGVLLLILKIIGIILLSILGLILLICFIPVGVMAEYSREGPAVTAKIGPIPLKLLPRPPKTEEQTQKEQQKKAEKAKKEQEKKEKKAQEKQKKQESEKPKEKPKLGGLIPLFKDLLGIVIDFLSHFRRKLKIKELTLHLTIGGGGDDPANSAKLYGMAWAALGNLWTVLERVFIIQNRDVQVNIDFFTEENTVYVKATARIFVGAVLQMGILYGLRALRSYLKYRKQTKKSKHEKGGIEHGTSSQ